MGRIKISDVDWRIGVFDNGSARPPLVRCSITGISAHSYITVSVVCVLDAVAVIPCIGVIPSERAKHFGEVIVPLAFATAVLPLRLGVSRDVLVLLVFDGTSRLTVVD